MAITLSLVASQTSGPAPLGVVFDASGTTGSGTSKPFEELHYQWDYGEGAIGVWAFDQKPKNRDIGPIAAHVFEAAGTFTVTLRIWGTNGDYAKATQSISVTDPDTVFATTDTYVVNKVGDSDFTGKPTGASEQNTDSWTTILGLCAAGKRVLLKRGSTWQTSVGASLNNTGPGILGAYGTGAKPIVQCTATGQDVLKVGNSGAAANWRFMDVQIEQQYVADGQNGIVVGPYGVTDCLFLRDELYKFASAISLTPWGKNETTGDVFTDGVILCELIASGLKDGGNGYCCFSGATYHFGIIGCDFWQDADNDSNHNFRTEWMQRVAITHNKVRSEMNGHHLKINAPLWEDNYLTRWGTADWPYHHYTEYVYVGSNRFYRLTPNSEGPWDLQIAPQDKSSYDERVRHVIVEGNYFDVPSYSHGSLITAMCAGDDIVVRNNCVTIASKASRTYRLVSIDTGTYIPTPSGLWIYNNSVYYPGDSSEYFYACDIASGISGVLCRNNVVKCPSITNRAWLAGSGSGTQSNNDFRDSPGWATTAPTRPEDFALQSGSACINAGYSSGVPVRADFNVVTRDYGQANDQGAFEYEGSKRTLFRQ